jgi:hypothetical protein
MADVNRPDLLFYGKGNLSDAVASQERKLAEAAEVIPAEHALARSTDELAAELVEQFRIKPLDLDWESMTVSTADARIDVTDDPRRFIFADEGRVLVASTRFTFHIPFTGEADLFKLRPSTFSLSPPRGIVAEQELQLVAEVPADNRDGLKSALDAEVEEVKTHVGRANDDVDRWNARLPDLAKQHAERRRQKVIGDRELVALLGVPVRRREDAAPTYAVAPVRHRATRVASPSGRRAAAPEPVLPNEEYERILEICRGMATVLERSPKAFARADEEAIRNHFLVQLNGQYQGGATGETFNYEGKTDILIRENGRNLFVAECKFWAGPKKLSTTIDQIVGYLSWRDTKSAIFVFNRGRELTKVLAAISPTVRSHPSSVREIAYGEETDFRFVLRHRDDPERELTLTVLVFEVPAP